MHQTHVWALAVWVGMAAIVAADDKKEKPDNYYKRAKVGDWISHKSTIKGQPFETVTKQSVTAKDDKTITIKTETKVSGMDFTNEAKMPLEPAIDPETPNPFVKTETVGKGKETIKVGGKSHACEWTKTKFTTKIENKENVSISTVWICKDLPMGGIVKMESKSDDADTVMEMVGYGRAKD